MTTRILQGNVFDMLPTIAPGSVDVCCTSPPYWNLRSYLPRDHPLKSQELGLEKSPAEFIANMVRVFDLVRDCLADHGTCFINIGDTYSNSSTGGGEKGAKLAGTSNRVSQPDQIAHPKTDLDSGNICLIPQRLAISLQDAGWIVRSVIIWHKPSAMPASLSGWSWRRCRVKDGSNLGTRNVKVSKNGNHRAVASFKDERTESGRALSAEGNAEWSDCHGCKKCRATDGYVLRRGSWRPTSSYEPILMLAKSPCYFADGEPVKTSPAAATINRDKYTSVLDDEDEQFAVQHDHETICTGANLRDVWTICAESLREAHYAAYPTELVRRCLQAGTSAKGYCPGCGAPWARMIETTAYGDWRTSDRKLDSEHGTGGESDGIIKDFADYTPPKTIGWRPSCKCPPAEPRSGLVLDPFCGSGRTGIAAMRLGLDFIGCELNERYVEMAQRIFHDESPLFSPDSL